MTGPEELAPHWEYDDEVEGLGTYAYARVTPSSPSADPNAGPNAIVLRTYPDDGRVGWSVLSEVDEGALFDKIEVGRGRRLTWNRHSEIPGPRPTGA
jgi:hypothetical protein